MRAALQAWLSYWRRQPVQLLLLVLGLAMATGLWSAVQAINAEARANYAKALEQTGSGVLDVLIPAQGTIPVDRYVALRRAGWKLAPVLEGRWRLRNDSYTLIGVDLLNHPVLPALTDAAMAEGTSPLAALTPPGRLFADPALRDELAGLPDIPPVTWSDSVPAGTILTDIAVAERLLQKSGEISRLLILPDQPQNLAPLQQLAPGLIRQSPADSGASTRLTDSFHLNLTAFGLLSFAVGLFIVHATVGLAFEQRRGLVRTLRALGLPLHHLILLAAGELLLLALTAGALGLVFGYLVAAALLPDVAATLRGLYGAPVEGGLTLRPTWFASGLGMAILGTTVAGSQALWNLTRLPLLSAPGQHSWSVRNEQAYRWMAVVGAALIGAGILAVVIFDGLIAGFVLTGGLMLGTALTLPAGLSLLLDLGARRARSVTAQWVWADTKAQLPGLSLALMALLLALATNVGVGTMVSSFRLTFLGWMDQRLSADVYVTARTDSQGAEMARWFDEQNITALPIRWSETAVNGTPVRIYGVVDDELYRDNWPILSAQDKVWDKVMSGQAVLVNEQLARRDGLGPGSALQLTAGWELPVAGVYSDYGNPNGQAIVALPALLERHPDIPFRQFGLRLDPQKVPDVLRQLRGRFDLPARALVDQAGIKARSLEIFDKTFVVTGALNILTLGVACFAILTSLLTIWRQRQPQLAPVWALGMTRARLAQLELLRSALLAALTALFALPLGLVIAWVLLSVINVEAFGWQLPMFLFPLDWLRLFVLTLLAALIAAAWPARKLSRTEPADLLRVFVNER